MGRSVLAMIAAAALGMALVVPNTTFAAASGVSRGSSAAKSGSGFRAGAAFRGTHGGVARGTSAVRDGRFGRHGRAAGRHAHHEKQRDAIFGSAGFDPVLFELALQASGCQVQRVQIDDDYGWRVRDIVVCPRGGVRPSAGATAR
jgi:hypothetical protein